MLIIKYIFFYLLNNIIYLATTICLLAMFKFDKKAKFNLFILYMLLFSFGFFVAAFLLTSFPLEWVLWTALDRIMFETSGLFVILIPLFYDLLKRKFS